MGYVEKSEVSDDRDSFKMKGLEQVLKALKKRVEIRVGILGKGARDDGTTNAYIGACHEFGTVNLPQRSFLRVPIAEHLDNRLRRAGAFDKEMLKRVIASGSVRAWAEKVGVVAEGIVLEAFDTGGFGQWRPSNMTRKKNRQTLVETQQLRNSITHDVKGG